jgi:zinc D-Ala-D-Ala carboxypeptidase
MDIDMDGSDISNRDVFMFIKDNLEFDQLIWEFGTKGNPDWVHVSYNTNGNQRKQVLIAKKYAGKTTYLKF